MPWCPNCGYEYRDGIAQCADCGAELAGTPPSQSEREPLFNHRLEDLVFLTEAADGVEAGILLSMLRAEGIAAVSREAGAGEVLKLYMGSTVYGVNLFVPPEDLDRALPLVEDFRAGGDGGAPDREGDEPESDGETGREPGEPKPVLSFSSRRKVVRIGILIFLIPALLLLVMQGFSALLYLLGLL